MFKLLQVPELIKEKIQSVEWVGPAKDNNIYLTFDDGPTTELCPFILDTLETFNAKATFFCVGENVKKYPELTQKISNQGHALGNHTYKHLNGWKTGAATYIADVLKCSEYIDSNLFRPPYGKLWFPHIKQLKNYGFRIILWSILSYDFHSDVKPLQIINHIEKNVKAGDIIVFHDNIKARSNLTKSLAPLLEFFYNKGFNLSSLK